VRKLWPFFMPLFTQVPRTRRLLGIPYAGSRINWNPDATIPTQSLYTTPRRLAQHLGGVHTMRFFGCSTTSNESSLGTETLLASGALGLRQDGLHYSRTPSVRRGSYVRQCQKCQKCVRGTFGTFGTLLVEGFRTYLCRRGGSIWTDLFCVAWVAVSRFSGQLVRASFLKAHPSIIVSPLLGVWLYVFRKP
jgi:hypothetical protein